MPVITRIKNNQITDATITNQKIALGTLTGALFNANLVLNSNVSIIGNLSVSGSSSSVTSTDTYVNDPVVVFNNGYSSSLSGYDIGILVNRNLASLAGYPSGVNTAWVWTEDDSAFEAITTTDTGGGITNLTNSGWANIKVGNITAINATLSGALSAGSFSAATLNGNLVATNAVITNLSTGNAYLTGGTVSGLSGAMGTLYVTNFSTANAVISGGSAQGLTTLQATNFSTGNAMITGGTISGVSGSATTLFVTNFSSGNAQVSGGYADNFPIGANTAASGKFTTGIFTGNIDAQSYINVTQSILPVNNNSSDLGNSDHRFRDLWLSGNTIYLGTATIDTNSSGNLILRTGNGNFISIANTAGNTFSIVGNLVTSWVLGNLKGTSAEVTSVTATNGTITTLSGTDSSYTTAVVTNFSTGNAWLTGGTIDNMTIGSGTASSGKFTSVTDTGLTSGRLVLAGANGLLTDNSALTFGSGTLNTTNLTATGIVNADSITSNSFSTGSFSTTNFSTSNAQITGGNVQGIAYLQATNFSTGNAQITGGAISGATGAFTTLYGTSFSTSNATISGGNISGLTSLGVTTLYAQNFSTGNARISGGYADNFPIGANTAATGRFTNVTITDTTPSTGYTSGALVVSGGIGVSENSYFHSNVIINGNLTVNGPTTTIGSADLTVQDSIINLHTFANLAALTLDDGKDIGIKFHYYKGVDNHAFLGWANDTGYLEYYAAGTEVANVFTGTAYGTIKSGGLLAVNSTASTSTTTGAVVVTGGVGIGGNLNVGGILSAGTLSATSIDGTPIGSTTPSTGYFTTLYSQNFSTGNAQITGGTITGVSGGAGTFVVTNFSTANAQITGGSITGATGAFTTLQATNFSSGNVVISGGYISALTNATITTGSITNLSSTTAVATNFSTGNAQITGGSVTGLTEFGATTGVVTNFSTANAVITGGSANNLTGLTSESGTIATLNSTSGNVTTLYAQNFSTGNAVISGGYISALTNATITTGSITNLSSTTAVATNFSTGNAVITGGSATNLSYISATAGYITNFESPNVKVTGGTIDGTAIGGTSPSTAAFTTLNASGLVYFSDATEATSSNIASVVLAGGLAVNKKAIIGGNIVAAATTESTGPTVGSFVAKGGVGVAGNVFLNKALTVNDSQATAGDLRVKGSNDTSLILTKAVSSYDQVLIGGSATNATFVPGAKLQINSADSILLPKGGNADRPAAAGHSDVAGMFRYNTTSNAVEWYNGSSWQSGATTFTVITDEQFNGDDSTTVFTLGAASTTNSTIVSINGVVQIPTLAYSVSGTTLTFTEAPATGDVIDVRRLTTTQTLTGLSSANGYMSVEADNTGIKLNTGSGSSSNTTSWDTSGAQVSKIANVTIASSGVATTIDSFDKTVYRTARYIVQATYGSGFYSQDAIVVHDGSTTNVGTGVGASIGGSLGTISATISGSNVLVQFTASNAGTVVRIKKDYIII